MKKKNSKCEFASERSELLLRNFRESIARQSVISAARAFKEAVDSPAPRFWVSEVRATRIISLMLKGDDVLAGMHTKKREMFMEIYQRVQKIRTVHPEMPLGDIVFEVVNNPAPSSYLTIASAHKIIYRMKKIGRAPFSSPKGER